MMTRIMFALAAATIALGACDSNTAATGRSPSSGGASVGGDAAVRDEGGQSGGTAGQPSGSGGGPSTDASADSGYVAPPGSHVVTLDTTPFELMTGGETYMCQNFDNPFGGQDAAIQDIVTDLTPGTHHMNLFYGTNGETGRTLQPCSGSEFHPFLHAAGRPHVETTYEPDTAAKLLGTSGVRMQVHFLSMSSQTLTVGVHAKLTAVDPSAIDKWVSDLYFANQFLQVPPASSRTISTTCAIPSDFGTIGLLGGDSHMHSLGAHFVASTSTGAMLVDTTQWSDPPPVAYTPPVMLSAGDTISWACTYDNTTANTIKFGKSDTNEECVYVARFYSSPTGTGLECLASAPTGQTAVPGSAE